MCGELHSQKLIVSGITNGGRLVGVKRRPGHTGINPSPGRHRETTGKDRCRSREHPHPIQHLIEFCSKRGHTIAFACHAPQGNQSGPPRFPVEDQDRDVGKPTSNVCNLVFRVALELVEFELEL